MGLMGLSSTVGLPIINLLIEKNKIRIHPTQATPNDNVALDLTAKASKKGK